jgi:hypothetical protein
MQRSPQRYLFHAYQRVAWMLSGPRGVGYSDELFTREQRLVEADWHIHRNSWEPFLWILRLLPFIALAQTFWMFYAHLDQLMDTQREVQEVVGMVLWSLVPFAQVLVLTVFFQLIHGLLRRLDNLYLADIDSLLYDQLLSRLPLHSSDTVLMMRLMRQEIRKLQEALQRIESHLGIPR